MGVAGGINFLPQGNAGRRNTSDRRAMIQDTSSEEDNKSETSRYIKVSILLSKLFHNHSHLSA